MNRDKVSSLFAYIWLDYGISSLFLSTPFTSASHCFQLPMPPALIQNMSPLWCMKSAVDGGIESGSSFNIMHIIWRMENCRWLNDGVWMACLAVWHLRRLEKMLFWLGSDVDWDAENIKKTFLSWNFLLMNFKSHPCRHRRLTPSKRLEPMDSSFYSKLPKFSTCFQLKLRHTQFVVGSQAARWNFDEVESEAPLLISLLKIYSLFISNF